MLACPSNGAHGLDEWIQYHVEHKPESTAIIHGTQSLDYRQLNEWVNYYTAVLSKWNLRREEPVCVLAPMGASHIAAQLAVIRLGGSSVPLDIGFPDERIHNLLRPLGTRLVITTESVKPRVQSFQTMVIPEVLPDQAPVTSPQDIPYPVRSDGTHRTHILHTSGTTGIPKPVEIMSKGITRISFNNTDFQITENSRIAAVAAPSFDATLVEVWATLSRGATVVVLPKEIIVDPYSLVENIENHRVSGMILTTALLNHVVPVIPTAFKTMDWLMSGGEKANNKIFKAILEHGPPKYLFNGFGPTENTCIVSSHTVTLEDCEGDIPIGKPVDGTTCFVLGEDLRPVESMTIGRLHVSGTGLARGYYAREEANRKAFLELPGLIPGSPNAITRVYDTGDLVRQRADGTMEFCGRADSQIKMRGYRVEPGEIESALLNSCIFKSVFVAPIKREGKDTYLVAFAIPNDGSLLNMKEVQAYMKRTLPVYMIPRIEVVDEFPFTVHGKVDSRALVGAYINKLSGTEQFVQIESAQSNHHETTKVEDARNAVEQARRAYEEAMRAEENLRTEKSQQVTQLKQPAQPQVPTQPQAPTEPKSTTTLSTLTPNESTVSWVTGLWESLLDDTELEDDSDFFEAGGSSLQAAAVIVQVRQRFGKKITIKDISENSTLTDFSRLLDSITHDRGAEQGRQMDLMLADTKLTSNIKVLDKNVPDWTSQEEGHVFLTGATGFLGIHMIRELVDQSYIKTVRCLVRADNEVAGKARLVNELRKYGLDDSSNMHKVIVVPGDLGNPQFGLSSTAWATLAQEISAVFHFAAHVNYVEQYEKHRDSNVLGTVTAIELSVAGRTKSLHYTSTAAISGPVRHFAGYDLVKEADQPQKFGDWIKYDIGYTQSKWVTEHLMQDMISKGLPLVLYRPGFMMGATETGNGNNSDFMARLFQGCIQIGCRPYLPNQAKSMIPVDYCTTAIRHISSNAKNFGQTFHLTPQLPSDDIDLEELWGWLSLYGYTLETVSYKDWLERLTGGSSLLSNPLLPLLPALQEPVQNDLTRWELWNNMAFFDTTHTQEALADCAETVSSRFSIEQLGRHIDNWKAHGLLVPSTAAQP